MKSPEIKPYWSAYDVVKEGLAHPFPGEDEDAIVSLESLLRKAIKGQMMSDVPLGAFLSGGIDSSLIVSLMQAESSRPVKTFTIGFNETGYNEAIEAKRVANFLGTEHTELYINPEEARSVIPLLPDLYDEPFSDSSQIPTYLVSKLARTKVTVSLSGDGGDELFGGYNRYFETYRIWNKIGRIPQGLRKLSAKGILGVSPNSWDHIYRLISFALPSDYKYKLFGDKVHKLARVLGSNDIQGIYNGFITHWNDSTNLVRNASEIPTALNAMNSLNICDQRAVMMYLDLITYLPDDILVKVDRAAMGVSLETRVPFLDHRVIEFAWKLPPAMKFKENKGKWILREILSRYIPREMFERPKMGFGVPIGDWMRGPLREWTESLINEDKLKNEGYLNPELIRQRWDEHLSGAFNWQYHILDILMFEAWLDKNKSV